MQRSYFGINMRLQSTDMFLLITKINGVSVATLLAIIIIGFFSGCSPIPRLVTQNIPQGEAQPLGIPELRVHIDPSNAQAYNRFFTNSLKELIISHSETKKPMRLLALSGGGDNGAFGAGFLNGWSAKGKRPGFDIVTGVSTGSLMAPFAFLGKEYDDTLKTVYTEISQKDIFLFRNLIQLLRQRDGLADSKPLENLIEKYIDDDLIARIAKEHNGGKRLYIGTTNLDKAQLVIWDMGEIAISGHPNAKKLFQEVLLASSSIPVAFPPVFIESSSQGNNYDEMHVDGGVMNQIFAIEMLAHQVNKAKFSNREIPIEVYMIRNSSIRMNPKIVERKIIDIAGRSVDLMIKNQALGDLYRNYIISQMAGIEYYMTSIPEDIVIEDHELFDTEYMNTMYQIGYDLAQSESAWFRSPPGLEGVKVIQEPK